MFTVRFGLITHVLKLYIFQSELNRCLTDDAKWTNFADIHKHPPPSNHCEQREEQTPQRSKALPSRWQLMTGGWLLGSATCSPHRRSQAGMIHALAVFYCGFATPTLSHPWTTVAPPDCTRYTTNASGCFVECEKGTLAQGPLPMGAHIVHKEKGIRKLFDLFSSLLEYSCQLASKWQVSIFSHNC